MANLRYNFQNDNFIVYEGANSKSKKVEYKMPIMSTPLDVTDWANSIITRENEDGVEEEIPIARDDGFLSTQQTGETYDSTEETQDFGGETQQEEDYEYQDEEPNYIPQEGATIEETNPEIGGMKKYKTPPYDKKELLSRKDQAMNFFISKGLTRVQAAGIVGNLMHESSGLDTRALNKNENAIGLAQWRFDRIDNLKKFAKSKGTSMYDFNTQLEFIWEEMTKHDRFIKNGVLDRIRRASNVDDIAWIFMHYYESADPNTFTPRKIFARECLK